MSIKSLVGAQGLKLSTGVAQLLEMLEKGFTVLVLLLSTAALLTLRGVQPESGVFAVGTQEGDPVARFIWVVVYVVTFSLVAARWRQYMYADLRGKLLLLLMGLLLLVLVWLAFVSILWSAAPDVTLRRGIALLGTTLIGIYLAIRYSLGEQLRLLAWALGIAALLSLLFALALPSYGISSGVHEGAWKGIFSHKQTLGRLMALSALVFLLLGVSSRRYQRVACAIFFSLSIGLLLLSDSITALIVFLVVLGLLPFCNVLRWRYTLAVPVLIALILLGVGVAALLLYNLEVALNVLGRDATLTGRTELWIATLEMIRQSPWLGYGYGAFWLGWEGKSAYIWSIVTWQPANAHNGFLDLWLDLGLLGILVFGLGLVMSSWRAVVWVRSTRTVEGFWPLACLLFIFLSDLSQSAILDPNNIYWILYVAVALSIFIPRLRGVRASRIDLVQSRGIGRACR